MLGFESPYLLGFKVSKELLKLNAVISTSQSSQMLLLRILREQLECSSISILDHFL